MKTEKKLRVLLVATHCDEKEIGETQNAHNWVSNLAEVCDVVLITQYLKGWRLPSLQYPNVTVIEWEEPRWYRQYERFERFNAALRPWYPSFYRQARKRIKQLLANGEHFDVMHQLTPLAIRYPSPCVGLGVPFIIGPLAGGVSTPPAFKAECKSAPLYIHLRNLDDLRLRFDLWLRRTYEKADIVLCSSPYVQNRLSNLRLKRSEVFCEVGVKDIPPQRKLRDRKPGELRMLHIGRAVRTKGLRDAVRAMAELSDLPNVTLDVAGGGEELEPCRQEAKNLGVESRINFLGRVPHQQVEELYKNADLFLFPSFREPTGIVLFEAMKYSLPIITTDRGGPAYIVDESCGVRVSVHTPEQFKSDLALAIRGFIQDENKLAELSAGAHRRVTEIGLWENKIKRMLNLYQEIC